VQRGKAAKESASLSKNQNAKNMVSADGHLNDAKATSPAEWRDGVNCFIESPACHSRTRPDMRLRDHRKPVTSAVSHDDAVVSDFNPTNGFKTGLPVASQQLTSIRPRVGIRDRGAIIVALGESVSDCPLSAVVVRNSHR
jgi:hypothetical protein